MTANVGHFAIECDDVERAKRFYEAVFGWRIEPWGPPDYYRVLTGAPEQPGIHGDLRTRRQPLTGTGNRGFECTVTVESLDATLAAIEANGGHVDGGSRHRIEGVGDLAYFEDTEGNRVGVMQEDPAMQPPPGVART